MSSPLLSVENALDILNRAACKKPVTEREKVKLSQLDGRILAKSITSALNVPPHDNTAMDGFVVRAQDCNKNGTTRLPISGRIQAGAPIAELQPGTAMRIFTGAPIPTGGDTIIIQEDTEFDDIQVRFSITPKQGQHIRRAGEDIEQGAEILKQGQRLRPADVGLLASVGQAEAHVIRRPKVAFFSTGDELTEPGQPLKEGTIYNSNRYVLQGLLTRAGCTPIDMGTIPDNKQATTQTLQAAAQEADLIITTGGVSVGEEDHVRAALTEIGQLDMWRIRMKPGKPVAYGNIGKAHFLGLPGNPVSVFATFMIFARPFIAALRGETLNPTEFMLPIHFDLKKPLARREFMRVCLVSDENGSRLEKRSAQGSGILSSVSNADGLAILKEDRPYMKGDLVSFLPFEGLLTAA